jgi:rhodanese-related sulfurtransferase
MAVRMDEEGRDGGLLGGAVWIVLIGTALGFAFNALGLKAEPAFGVAWIAKDKTEDVFVLGEDEVPAAPDDAVPPTSAGGGVGTDDPLAAMLGQQMASAPPASDLPTLPDLGRPIQMQLSVVKKFFDADAALFLDAREDWEYREGHIPGAVHLPFDQAVTDPARLEALEADGRPMIVYCGGGECELSINLAWELIQAGHGPVTYFQGGYPEWVENGFPVAQGAGSGEGAS